LFSNNSQKKDDLRSVYSYRSYENQLLIFYHKLAGKTKGTICKEEDKKVRDNWCWNAGVKV
jgi:hypothetical protein